jgi:hypothetical protein
MAFGMSLFMLAPASLFASSHREAPITALDHTADVTDWYAFVSYDNPNKVTMILNVDPLLEPANGPNYFPFDDSVVYQMLVDNNQSGKARNHSSNSVSRLKSSSPSYPSDSLAASPGSRPSLR